MDRADEELNTAVRKMVGLTLVHMGGRFNGGLESGPPPISQRVRLL